MSRKETSLIGWGKNVVTVSLAGQIKFVVEVGIGYQFLITQAKTYEKSLIRIWNTSKQRTKVVLGVP